MSFDEVLSMVFQPGMFDIFCLALSLVVMAQLFFALFVACIDLFSSLLHRFIWPGKKSQDDKEVS